VQLALQLDGGRRRSVDVAVDAVRERFGAAAITRGVLIGRDPGFEMPLLPE
jgi:DNA polymerase-4